MQPSSPPCISTTFPSSQTATLYSLYNSLPSPLPSTSAAAAAKSLQSCPTLCDPIDSSPSGSPSLGFSRQEHWSRLPFPSPTHESEKWKQSRSVVSNSSRPNGLQPTRLLHPWDFPCKSTGVGCHRLLWSTPYPRLIIKLSQWPLSLEWSREAFWVVVRLIPLCE